MSVRQEVLKCAEAQNPNPPFHLGPRHTRTEFLPQAGNTVVAHLDTNALAHHAVLKARARMKALPGAERLLFTPEDSLHMTVLDGVLETRRIKASWPKHLDVDTAIDDVTADFVSRLDGFVGPAQLCVRATGIRPAGLILEGTSDADKNVLSAWRDALGERFNMRHPNHQTYVHHMTFAYQLDWLPDDLLDLWQTELSAILQDLTEAAPVIPLKPPAFCRFGDMTFFEELVSLDAAETS